MLPKVGTDVFTFEFASFLCGLVVELTKSLGSGVEMLIVGARRNDGRLASQYFEGDCRRKESELNSANHIFKMLDFWDILHSP